MCISTLLLCSASFVLPSFITIQLNKCEILLKKHTHKPLAYQFNSMKSTSSVCMFHKRLREERVSLVFIGDLDSFQDLLYITIGVLEKHFWIRPKAIQSNIQCLEVHQVPLGSPHAGKKGILISHHCSMAACYSEACCCQTWREHIAVMTISH